MRCSICEKNDWENVDRFRLKPSGMTLCRNCGFVSYKEKYKTEEEIKEYYRTKYRGVPQISHVYSGERKLQYHEYFLNPLFKEWEAAGLKNPDIGEIGSAMGMFLNWIKLRIPDANIHGTELTQGFRKVAYHEFGVDLKEDFDTSKKYDLIASYHVLEHQLDPDKRLKEYAACLKDHGVFYLSCPIWFRDCNNSATGGFDIEYYWHPDHINAWSETHLEWVIAKAGLEIVFKNDNVYGNTYILKKSKKIFEEPKWESDKNKSFIEMTYKLWLAISENRTKDAIDLYKNCPAAWLHHYELNRQHFHKDLPGLNEFLRQAEESCTNTADAQIMIADIFTRYERYSESLEMFKKALNKKPNSPTIVMGMSNCFRQMALKEPDQTKKIELIGQSINCLRFVRDSSMEMRDKAASWMFHDMTILPLSNQGV